MDIILNEFNSQGMLNNGDIIVLRSFLEELEEDAIVSNYEESKFVSIASVLKKNIINQLVKKNWKQTKYIFKDNKYMNSRWTNQLSYNGIVMNFCFDHHYSICWNLVRGELDTRPNYIEKNGYSEIQILVTATKKFQKSYGFDPSIGTYEDYVEFMKPLQTILHAPVILIGLNSFNTFKIQKIRIDGKNKGKIIRMSS